MRNVYLYYDPISSGYIGILPEGPLIILAHCHTGPRAAPHTRASAAVGGAGGDWRGESGGEGRGSGLTGGGGVGWGRQPGADAE